MTSTVAGAPRAVWIASLGKRSTGEVRVRTWSESERFARAAKALGVFWGLAVLSVVVPAAHFVLVPAFLLAGPIAAVVYARQRSTVVGGEGACPSCGANVVIGRAAESWPLEEVCGACKAPLRVDTQ